MTDKFKKCILIVLRNEGGFVNDASDPGGATNYGISLRFLKLTGDLDFDLDNDGDLDIRDIVAMTTDKAADAYHKYFWQPLKLDQLKNDELALQVLDFAVNAGLKAATITLQRIAGCKTDGIMGIKTISSANTFIDNIAERYKTERVNYYKNLTLRKPSLKCYLKGWINRCDNTHF